MVQTLNSLKIGNFELNSCLNHTICKQKNTLNRNSVKEKSVAIPSELL